MLTTVSDTNPKVADALPPDLQLALSALEEKDRGGDKDSGLCPGRGWMRE